MSYGLFAMMPAEESCSMQHIITGNFSKAARILSSVAVATLLASCGAPNNVGMQGRLTNASGVPLNGNYTLKVEYNKCESGSGFGCGIVYSETKTIDVVNGIFDTDLGSGVMATTSALDPGIFAQPLYAEFIINGERLSPRQKVTGAPYALSLTPGAVVAGTFTNDDNFPILTVANAANVVNSSPVLGLAIGSSSDAPFIKACKVATAGSRSCSDAEFIVQANGNVNADGAFSSPAADYAEIMAAVGDIASYSPGDVLVISASKDRAVEKSAGRYDSTVIGIYSTKPGFIGGQPIEGPGPNTIPVAMVGIVPVKVSAENGAIQRGDLLTSAARAGHAMKAVDAPAGTIIGKALGELNSGTGVIEVVLMAR
jgi:hypothetical protein